MDKDKELITAEQFIRVNFGLGDKYLIKWDLDATEVVEAMHEYAVLFAKYHRERSIEAIRGEALKYQLIPLDEVYESSYQKINSHIVDSIENAYKETEIK